MRREIEVIRNSIVNVEADAVVNASNPDAVLGGGVSRALFDACGGPVLQDEMREKLGEQFDGKLDAEDCLVTSAGTSTKFRFVLHVASVDYRNAKAVGDRMQASSAERITLATEAALRAAIDLARDHGPLAVAFPLLGAGSGGVAPGLALKAMVDGLRRVFKEEPDAPVHRVVFAVPDYAIYELAKQRLEQLLVLR